VVVVVSAMGRFPYPYSTDSLLQLVRKETKPKHKDLIISCGEAISVAVIADLLEAEGMAAETMVFDKIGVLTNDRFGDAEILEINIAPIMKALKNGSVAVIAGFQGMTAEHKIATLGRGGSDTTATALGAALKADLVEIYTDVDGVFSADPKIVPDAYTMSDITFEEVGEMAHHGAKVLHPKAVSFALEAKVPIRVRSTFSDQPGTSVHGEPVKFQHVVTAVTHIPNMAYAQVEFPNVELDEARHHLFKAFAEAEISLDLITITGKQIDFIIKETDMNAAMMLLSKSGWKSKVEKGFAKVSVVGAGMRGKPGVMFQVVDALYQAHIALYHSTDSHSTIACLVKQSEMEKAIQVLHKLVALE